MVTGVKFVTDSSATIRYIVTTSRDRTIKIWSVSGLGLAQTQVLLDQTVAAGEGRNSVNHIKSIWGVDVKWPYIGTASADNTLKAWKFNEADCKFITPSKEPKFKHIRDAKKVKKNAANNQVITKYRCPTMCPFLGQIEVFFKKKALRGYFLKQSKKGIFLK